MICLPTYFNFMEDSAKAKKNIRFCYLSSIYFYEHIQKRHPEMSISMIRKILRVPDQVYSPFQRSKDLYFEKTIDEKTYRVVTNITVKKIRGSGNRKRKRAIRIICTAYQVKKNWYESKKRNTVIFDRKFWDDSEKF